MKKQLVAACVAALSFSQFACEQRSPTDIQPPSPAANARSVEAPAVIASKRVEAVTLPVPRTEPAALVQETDLLPLAHEDGRDVDHLVRVTRLREQGDLEGALAEARRALFDAPNDTEVLAHVDRLSRLTGERKLRVIALERLAALAPNDAMPLIHKARVMITLKDYEGAITVANDAIARDANNPEAYQALGRAHLSRGELSAAITSFQKVVSLAPDHGYALNNLGLALLRANQNEEAVTALSRAAELLPNVAYVHNNLGVALEREQRFEEAKEAYARSSFLSPKYVKAQLNAARVAALTLGSDMDEGVHAEADEAPDVSFDEGSE